MREKERSRERRRLDAEMRPYRHAGAKKNATKGLLRAVRQTLHVPVAEIGAMLGKSCSAVVDLEASELRGTIKLRTMSRMAEALGCKVVYGIVPKDGKTLEELAEERLWARVLGKEAGTRN